MPDNWSAVPSDSISIPASSSGGNGPSNYNAVSGVAINDAGMIAVRPRCARRR